MMTSNRKITSAKLLALLLILFAVGTGTAPTVLAETEGPAVVDVFRLPEFQQATQGLSTEERFEAAAYTHIWLDQYQQAIPLVEVLVKRKPMRADFWRMLAFSYNRVDEPREAYDAAKIAITLEPSFAPIYLERGIAAFQLGRNREAVSDLTRFLKTYGLSGMGYYYLGLAQGRLGNLRAAREGLLRARTLSPHLALLTDYYVGLIDARSGKIKEAKAALKETVDVLGDSKLPLRMEVQNQLKGIQIADNMLAMRRALAESDAKNAAVPKPQ